jgi:hypothetical protein
MSTTLEKSSTMRTASRRLLSNNKQRNSCGVVGTNARTFQINSYLHYICGRLHFTARGF